MKILDIAFKDLVRSTRSLFLIGMAFAAPLLLTALIYFAFGSIAGGNLSMPDISVGIVNLDMLPADALPQRRIQRRVRGQDIHVDHAHADVGHAQVSARDAAKGEINQRREQQRCGECHTNEEQAARRADEVF